MHLYQWSHVWHDSVRVKETLSDCRHSVQMSEM